MRHIYRFITFCFGFVYGLNFSSAIDCGKPGHSRKSAFVDAQELDVYADGSVVKYRCQYLPVGNSVRKCIDGRWSNPIPKCPDLLNTTGLSVRSVTPNKIHLHWTKKMVLVGLRIAFRRPSNVNTWPKIQAESVDVLDRTWFNVASSSDENVRFFHITTKSTDVRFRRGVNRVVVKVKNQFANCAIDADGDYVQLNTSNIQGQYLCLNDDLHELYYIDETVDGCDAPDTPLNAQLTSTSTSFRYICNEGYRLRVSQIPVAPKCPKNGDWSSYNYQPCEEVFCDRDSVKYAIVSASQPTMAGSLVAVGTKGFLACSTPGDQRYVICTNDGVWVQETELCDSSFLSYDGFITVLAVTLVITLILMAAFGGFLLYRRSHKAQQDVDFNMSQMKTRDGTTKQIGSNDYIDSPTGQNIQYYDSLDYEAEDYVVATQPGVDRYYVELNVQ